MTRRRNPELAALLAAAGAVHGEQAARGERHERDLAAVLAAFNDTADSGPADGVVPGARAGVSRPRRVPGRLAVKCAAALIIAAGGGVAAAGAGVLPSPVQQFAHHVLGGIGVPGPRKPGTGTVPSRGATSSATPRAMATPRNTPVTVSASPSANATSTVLETLCGTVVRAGNSWRSDVSKADRAVLVAAAGSQQKVVTYCTSLLADTSSATAAPPAAGGATSAAATPAATKTHGNPHPSKSPKPTGTGN